MKENKTETDILNSFIRNYLRGVHTIKPAKVTGVTGNRVKAQILTTTKYVSGKVEVFPDVVDVPLMIYSGTNGTFRITTPIAKGDIVIILFSDRDTGSLLKGKGSVVEATEIRTHEFHPIAALPCIFTVPNEKPIEPNKIVIESGATSVKVGVDGAVEIIAPTGVTVTSPATVFTGTIACTGILPLPGASSVLMTGDIEHTGNYTQVGSFVLNGVTMETHRHSPSTSPPSNA